MANTLSNEAIRKHAYVVEVIKTDLFIKYLDFVEKNPGVDVSLLQKKLILLSGASDYILSTIDIFEELKHKLHKQELLINTLMKNVKTAN